ncbi:MAG TPA: hypothetical protein VM912_04785 [Terriglobales bacterium]|nr:hypothetical protein [Terriglobales bacterium]
MAGFPNVAFPEGTRALTPVRPLPTIRLDRAQRNTVTAAAVVSNNGQIYLYNNTNQGQILIVRAYSEGPAAALPVNIGYLHGKFGSAAPGNNQPLLPDRGLLAGQLFQNQGSLFTPDYVDYQGYAGAALSTSYPFGVLPPNWSMFWITQTVNQAFTVSVLWECLTADEFTEQYGSYA